MKENREDPAMLDRMLAQMAQETPEMPADFHARWTEKIRAEAGMNQQTNQQNHKQKESRRQWRYILSAAAVFVFLIGGTLLTRGMNQSERAKPVSPAVNMAMKQADSAPEPEIREAVQEPEENPAEEPVQVMMDAAASASEAGRKADETEDAAAGSSAAAYAGTAQENAVSAGMDMGAGTDMEADMNMAADMETDAAAERRKPPKRRPPKRNRLKRSLQKR